MKSCQVHGPLTKLMRWYSWWEGCRFHSGEMWMLKLLLLHGDKPEAGDYDPQLKTNKALSQRPRT